MKIIAFIAARKDDVIRKILQHCGLWHLPARPPPRAPPAGASAVAARRRVPTRPGPAAARRYAENSDLDPDFLEHLHREAQGQQLDLPWE